MKRWAFLRIGVVLLLFSCGCSTLFPPLPAINLTQPGWTVHQGQAVWTLPNGKGDIAGEVVVATGPGGKSFVQFSKSPFPLVVGQTTSNRWQIEFPPQHKRYSGPGTPPKRLIWLYLPLSLENKTPPAHWIWSNGKDKWHLENPKNGEKLEGFFSQ